MGALRLPSICAQGGGECSFGIVTRLVVKTHTNPGSVTMLEIVWPETANQKALAWWQVTIASALITCIVNTVAQHILYNVGVTLGADGAHMILMVPICERSA